ncbi:serine/threonine-protein kinase [Nannocystis pusilla]|uniref:serine/threonine-protein kinase n=1 Tax=Nannocystis pusilla TaxID=889268 RepID=UPI003DA5C75C
MHELKRDREPDAPRARCSRRASVDLTGRVLGGRYKLLRRLGHGGSGATIYEAEHVEIRRRVAVKVLDPGLSDADAVARFTHEARAAAALRSEHIIDIIDFVRDDSELVYMVMECLEGEDLAATLANDGPLDWRRVLSIGTQVCRALIDAHARGVVHCDIKPGNCFRISRDGTDDFIKVLDFGVSSVGARAGDGRPMSGPVIGTPGYMPQEQLRGGPYDHRVDIFALGVLMFRLLTNKMPYSGGSLFVPRRPASGPIALRRAAPTVEIPDAFEAVILKSVAADPAERYQSARELLAALLAVADAPAPSRLARDPLAWGERSSAA